MMHTITRAALIASLLVFATGLAFAELPQVWPNVNTRYEVESVSVTGVAESEISQPLRDDMQALVGRKYDPDATEDLAHRLRRQLGDRPVSIRVKRGEHSRQVQVVFEVSQVRNRSFQVHLAPLLYTTRDGFSGAIVPGGETHHNYFSAGLISSADELLERNAGVLVRYEHRKVGTERLQVGFEYNYFHPSFQPETEAALEADPSVPGIYSSRQVFAPSFSILPVPELKVTAGASFQTLTMQYPEPHDMAAHALTLNVQFRREVRPRRGVRHIVDADYAVRHATSAVESDFLYTRQWAAAGYTYRVGRQSFSGRFEGGHISDRPPLFERFSIGNATRLRGWDKFDVAPLGGTRLLYGSLEYRYRPLLLFYDVGSVWDGGQSVDLKHSVGIGLASKHGLFVALGIPLRYHRVTPVFMFGYRL